MNIKDKKLYIAPLIPINSLKDVINCLYLDVTLNKRKWTANPTFLDEECQHIECAASRRSFEDILTIARTYFPETSEQDLMRVLISEGVGFMLCHDIHKVVFIGTANYREINSDHLSKMMYDDEDVFNDEDEYDTEFDWAEGTYTADKLIEIYNQL